MTARTVVLWRHGRTAYNAQQRLQGQVDVPLDEVGVWQAEEAAGWLAARYHPVRIVSSDLVRASATAQALARRCGVRVELDDRLRERGFGEWEGLTGDEVAQRWPDDYATWRRGQDPERGGAETRQAVADRVAQAVAEHASATDDDGTLVVVSHGAAITLGLTALLGLDATVWRGLVGLHNAHWAVLQQARGADAVPSWRVAAHNVGPSVRLSDWDEGVSTEHLPSSAADAMRA